MKDEIIFVASDIPNIFNKFLRDYTIKNGKSIEKSLLLRDGTFPKIRYEICALSNSYFKTILEDEPTIEILKKNLLNPKGMDWIFEPDIFDKELGFREKVLKKEIYDFFKDHIKYIDENYSEDGNKWKEKIAGLHIHEKAKKFKNELDLISSIKVLKIDKVVVFPCFFYINSLLERCFIERAHLQGLRNFLKQQYLYNDALIISPASYFKKSILIPLAEDGNALGNEMILNHSIAHEIAHSLTDRIKLSFPLFDSGEEIFNYYEHQIITDIISVKLMNSIEKIPEDVIKYFDEIDFVKMIDYMKYIIRLNKKFLEIKDRKEKKLLKEEIINVSLEFFKIIRFKKTTIFLYNFFKDYIKDVYYARWYKEIIKNELPKRRF